MQRWRKTPYWRRARRPAAERGSVQDGVCGELDYVAKSAESRGSMGADGKDRHIVERPTGTRGRPPARCRHASVACNGTRNQSGHRRTFAGLSPSSPDPPRRSDSLSQGDTCPNHARIVLMSTPVRRRVDGCGVAHGRHGGPARRDSMDGRRMLDELRSLPGDEPEQRVQRGETQIPCGGRVAADVFEVSEEVTGDGRVDLLHRKGTPQCSSRTML